MERTSARFCKLPFPFAHFHQCRRRCDSDEERVFPQSISASRATCPPPFSCLRSPARCRWAPTSMDRKANLQAPPASDRPSAADANFTHSSSSSSCTFSPPEFLRQAHAVFKRHRRLGNITSLFFLSFVCPISVHFIATKQN